MGSFAADIAKYAEKTGKSIDNSVRDVVSELHGEVDRRSPVGKREIWAVNIDRASRGLPPLPKGYAGGHFRNNNQYRFGNVPDGVIEGEDPSGAKATAVAKAGIYSSPAAGVHFIANNIIYAIPLEYGHSNQAPQGIYALSMMTLIGVLHRFGFK